MQVKDQFLEKQFMKRVLKKFQINLQARVKDFYPLGTFQYKNNMDISSSQMIVVATQDSQLLLYDTSGELISDLLELDHHSQFIATSPKYAFSCFPLGLGAATPAILMAIHYSRHPPLSVSEFTGWR